MFSYRKPKQKRRNNISRISQPRQEQIMKRLDYLEGSVSIISCGAFWIQRDPS